jgi:hypothetical protein
MMQTPSVGVKAPTLTRRLLPTHQLDRDLLARTRPHKTTNLQLATRSLGALRDAFMDALTEDEYVTLCGIARNIFNEAGS